MQPDDEIIIPQDDLYVITCETNFGDFPNSSEKIAIPTSRDGLGTSNDPVNDARAPDEIFTIEDLWSTGPHENDDFASLEKTRSERINDRFDDQQSSGGSDTIVPEVLDDENDDMIGDNESPRGGKYNLRPNPTPTSLMITDTSQIRKLLSHT